MHNLVSVLLVVATAASLPFVSAAATYYASPDGTGTGTEADPFSLAAGVAKVQFSSHTLVLKSGRYLLDGAIGITGPDAGNNPVIVRGESGNPEEILGKDPKKSEI